MMSVQDHERAAILTGNPEQFAAAVLAELTTKTLLRPPYDALAVRLMRATPFTGNAENLCACLIQFASLKVVADRARVDSPA